MFVLTQNMLMPAESVEQKQSWAGCQNTSHLAREGLPPVAAASHYKPPASMHKIEQRRDLADVQI